MNKKIIIGARGSKLSLSYVEKVKKSNAPSEAKAIMLKISSEVYWQHPKRSPKITTKVVIIMVEIIMPKSPNTEIKRLVAIADARILIKLLATNIVLMRCALWLINFSTIIALLSPFSERCFIRTSETAVNAVSDPEKNADKIIRPKIDPIRILIDISII